jgi:HB1, ASXL, restriction endonuclease HTH domain
MTAREITQAAIEAGILDTCGKTPIATMTARLYELGVEAAIVREAEPGAVRAKRGSVRWRYVGTTR